MIDTSKATPRPWQRYGSVIWGGEGERSATICAISEPRATPYVTYTELRIGSFDADEAWANAVLIVRAVNSYDQHLALIRQLCDALRGVIAVADRKTDEFDAARAALAKAEAS